MKCLIVLFAAAAVAQAQLVYPAGLHAAPLRTQYHAQDELGSYSFGYSGGPSSKVESSHGGVTQGAFSYVDAHGLVQSRNYVADPVNGFRVAGTDIPVDSNTPLAVTPLAHSVAPLAPAVRYAHAVAPLAHVSAVSHLSPYLLARRKRQAIYPLAHGYSYAAPLAYSAPAVHAYSAPVVHAYPAPVVHAVNPYPQDTPEVAATKIANSIQYNNEAVRNSLGRKKRSVLAYSALPSYSAVPAYSSYSYAAPLAYSAPVAPVVHAYAAPVAHAVNPYPQDTHEVAAAKINHAAQYNAEAARNANLAHLGVAAY